MKSWIMPYIKRYRWRILLSAFFALLGVASGAMLLFVSGYLISKSSMRPENIMVVYVPIVSVRAFSIGQAVFPYLEKLVSHDIVLRILSKYRNRLYAILEPQAMFLQSRYQTGDLLTVLSDDIEKLQDFFIKTLLPSFAGLFVYTVFAIVVGIFNVPFMLLILAMFGVIVFLMPSISFVLMAKKYSDIKFVRGRLYEQSTDAMFGQLDWLVSGQVDSLIERLSTYNHKWKQNIMNVGHWHVYRSFILQFIVGLIVIAMMFWTNVEVNNTVFSPTIIAAFVLMIFAVADALMPINEAVDEIHDYGESIHRIEALEKNRLRDTADLDWEKRTNNRLLVQSLSYRYPGTNVPIVKNVSFTVEQGEKVAILGRSGAGKSTILKLLSGLLEPDKGEILLDDKQINRLALGKSIAVLNQKPHLFHTTVANNVRIGNENASEEEIITALKQAGIYELIGSLPGGINTPMEEMGTRFSGGERQRIAFARALVQGTPIILLDEPTVGLDPITEMHLIKTFISAAKEKTIVLVTHHLMGAPLMDKIIFIDDGEIKLQGSHKQLMETNSYYRTLYEMDQGSIY